jgi:methyl acetate hydrolase
MNDRTADAVLSEAVQSEDLGCVVAMAARSQEVVYSGAYGQMNTDCQVGLDSIFRIASMTKPITSVAVMQLVEEGLIDLDEPACQYLPKLKDVKVIDGISSDSPQLQLKEQEQPITVRQLLNHTAGFGYPFTDPLLAEAYEKGLIPEAAAEDPPYASMPLSHQPGAAWSYGTSTSWLGWLVETVRSQSLDQVFSEYIFEPLGMCDTQFHVEDDKIDRLVRPRRRKDDGSLEWVKQTVDKPSFYIGGGGLYSTATDYIRFLAAFLRRGAYEGGSILSPSTVKLMSTSHTGDMQVGRWQSKSPDACLDIDLYPGGHNGFGLGFFIHGAPVEGGRSSGSLFWAGIQNTFFWIDHTRDVCGVFMSQSLPLGDPRVLKAFAEFETAVYSHHV